MFVATYDEGDLTIINGDGRIEFIKLDNSTVVAYISRPRAVGTAAALAALVASFGSEPAASDEISPAQALFKACFVDDLLFEESSEYTIGAHIQPLPPLTDRRPLKRVSVQEGFV